MKLEDLKHNEENTCPVCGSHMIEYDSSEIDGNCMWYPCECEKCGATWQEVYTITFNQVDEVYNNAGEKIYSSFDNE